MSQRGGEQRERAERERELAQKQRQQAIEIGNALREIAKTKGLGDTSYFNLAKVYRHECRESCGESACACGVSPDISHCVFVDRAAYGERIMRESFSGHIHCVNTSAGRLKVLVCSDDGLLPKGFSRVR